MNSRYAFSAEQATHHIVDKGFSHNAEEIFRQLPHALIYVLDFALSRDSELPSEPVADPQGRYIGHKYTFQERQLLNIDHHNPWVEDVPNFSTTHQVLSALDSGMIVPAQSGQVSVLNHDDTDSVLPLLLMSHQDVPTDVKDYFALAAKAADHTGEPVDLVDVIDVFYKSFNFGQLVPLINAVIQGKELKFPNKKQRQKYERLQALPETMKELVEAIIAGKISPHGSGSYDPESQILQVTPVDRDISTIRLMPVVEQLNVPVRLVMLTKPPLGKNEAWTIGLRSGPNFPEETTLMNLANQLQLQQFGYGGRRNAGGIGRLKTKLPATPEQIFERLKIGFLKQES